MFQLEVQSHSNRMATVGAAIKQYHKSMARYPGYEDTEEMHVFMAWHGAIKAV